MNTQCRTQFSLFKKLKFLLIIFLLLSTLQVSAEEQYEKLWSGVIGTKTLSSDKKWLASLQEQLRFIRKDNGLQTILAEGLIGYQMSPETSLWLGYRWSGHLPREDFYSENRVIQQLNWEIIKNKIYTLRSRTRLEELKRSDYEDVAWRVRQRFALELHHCPNNHASPYVYEEAFFPLNKTDHTSHQLLSENRLFLGLNYYFDKKTWWEIGYINQYIAKTPQSERQIDHILSLTYNFSC